VEGAEGARGAHLLCWDQDGLGVEGPGGCGNAAHDMAGEDADGCAVVFRVVEGRWRCGQVRRVHPRGSRRHAGAAAAFVCGGHSRWHICLGLALAGRADCLGLPRHGLRPPERLLRGMRQAGVRVQLPTVRVQRTARSGCRGAWKIAMEGCVRGL
jgi:hypothetical protein